MIELPLLPQTAVLARELMSASEGEEEDEEAGEGSQQAPGDDLPELPEGFAYSGRRKVSKPPLLRSLHILQSAAART